MEVRPDILKGLLCSMCDGYLSCAPIRMKSNGDKLCGRCSDPEGEPTVRITPYEELVKMVVFPCSNQSYGCREMLYMEEVKDHEEDCQYRQYVCPVSDSGKCGWFGSKKDILDHCYEQHLYNVLQEPFTIEHQIIKSYHNTFIMAALQMLFVVHCKVCISTKTIYHSVRLIGRPASASSYKYMLEVWINDDKLVRGRDVAPQGCLALQEDTSVQLDFQTMLRFLGGFHHVKFKLSVGWKCVRCGGCAIKFAWPTDEGWCCKDCAPARRRCKFFAKGCTYEDMANKVDKHELYYCEHGFYCFVCYKDVGSLKTHYEAVHSHVAHKTGTNWRIQAVNCVKNVLISSDVGILHCWFFVVDPKFELHVHSPICVARLAKYKCVVQFTNSGAGYTVRKTLSRSYNKLYDWFVEFQNHELKMYVCNGQVDIKIDLIEI